MASLQQTGKGTFLRAKRCSEINKPHVHIFQWVSWFSVLPVSATNRCCRTGGAIHEVSIVVATMNLAVAETEIAHVTYLTEGALVPSWMDAPSTNSSIAATTIASAAMIAATAGMQCAATLNVSPGVPAAPHLRGLVAEGADVVRLAKGSAPSTESRCM